MPSREHYREALAYYAAHVDDDTEQCVFWPYSNSKGYGQLKRDGRMQYVHALACERHYGPRPEGMGAIHAPVVCHNTLCFNWRHLSWGTQKQNAADRSADGTEWDRRGECNPQAKLTWEQVSEMRARYATGGISFRTLGLEYGVTPENVGHIIRERAWKPSRFSA